MWRYEPSGLALVRWAKKARTLQEVFERMTLQPIDSLILRNMTATVTSGLNAILIQQGDMVILAHLPQEAGALYEWLGRALGYTPNVPDVKALAPTHRPEAD